MTGASCIARDRRCGQGLLFCDYSVHCIDERLEQSTSLFLVHMGACALETAQACTHFVGMVARNDDLTVIFQNIGMVSLT